MSKIGQVFTPENYVIKLLDEVEYFSDLYGKKILENSCGDGQILLEVVKRYIEDCLSNHIDKNTIVKGLEDDIYGIEIDQVQHEICIKNLNYITEQYGLPRVKWQIFNCDFLKWSTEIVFDFIVGNPPYITYKDLSQEDRAFIRENFETCKYGKFDYCYAFIEKSIKLLNNTGTMTYLIPSAIFKTVFGSELRNFMLPYVTSILDFSSIDVFDNALVKSSIVKFKKQDIAIKKFLYKEMLTLREKLILKKELGDKWQFNINFSQLGRRFGDYYRISNSIATLYNKAFVLADDSYTVNEKGDVISRGIVLEGSLIKDAFSPRSIRYGRREKIIFPYEISEGEICRIDDKKIQKKYPGIYLYLSQYKEKLFERASDKTAEWFEYGRSQAINNLNCRKILMSTVVTNQVHLSILEIDDIPYSGLFIRSTDEEHHPLDNVFEILGSTDFLNYIKSIGIPISGNSIRITSRDIENYRF